MQAVSTIATPGMVAASRADRRQTWAGIAALIACAALWSLNGPLIKLLHKAEVPGITIAVIDR